jgi:hypothetical protein
MGCTLSQEKKWSHIMWRYRYQPGKLTPEIKEKFLNKTLMASDLPEPMWSYVESRNLRGCMNGPVCRALAWK